MFRKDYDWIKWCHTLKKWDYQNIPNVKSNIKCYINDLE